MANNKITEEHIKDIYQKLKDYYELNKDDFFIKTQKHIVEDIKKVVLNENKFVWNNASLTDYINDLIYMLKGQQFARTINSFSEKYFIEKICEDFNDELCSNAKESLRLHKEYYKKITNKKSNDLKKIDTKKDNNMKIKNIILYGAPGVGKTHNYQKLISMIENGYDESEIFHSITDNKTSEKVELNEALFQEIKDEKRVEFVTFHQSYSYEDFIEGFRPNKDGDIELDKYGVFKAISEKARINLEESKKDYQEISQEVTFKQKIEKFIEDLETKIESDGYYSITDSAYITSIDSDAFRYNIRREKPTYKYDLRMKFEDLYEFEKNNVQSRQDVKKLETINSLGNQHASYYFNVFKEINVQNINQNISNNEIKKEEQKNFYIVIDEINRGNISKIFGELITLLEESKRDNYEVTLPYSKEKFKVPSNLYIIATMNSTDKSIATIDIALRRRFTFLKMKPNSNLVKNQEAKELMKKLNIYIKKELGEDYMLGHSYFMGDDIDLEFIKVYKIKPLLEEYFYSDDKTVDEILQEALQVGTSNDKR